MTSGVDDFNPALSCFFLCILQIKHDTPEPRRATIEFCGRALRYKSTINARRCTVRSGPNVTSGRRSAVLFSPGCFYNISFLLDSIRSGESRVTSCIRARGVTSTRFARSPAEPAGCPGPLHFFFPVTILSEGFGKGRKFEINWSKEAVCALRSQV